MTLITSRRNSIVVAVRKLDQRKHRIRQGRFRVEGLQLLHMALDAGVLPLELFYSEELFVGQEAAALLGSFEQSGVRSIHLSADVIATLSDREVCQGLIATFPLVEDHVEGLSFSGQSLVLVLDRIQDPGNLGTIIRTADAVAAGAVVLVEPCVDPFDPKTVRGSMGSVFNVPLARTRDVPGLFANLKGRGLQVIGADVGAPIESETQNWSGGAAIVLGNEARGLSDDVRQQVDRRLALPIVGKAESLNVAVAAGILMYTWLWANLPDKGAERQPSSDAKA